MAGLYQTMLQQQGKKEKEQFNRAKGTVTSLINSYHASPSVEMKKQVATTMRDYYGGLPRPLRKAVEPYIRHSPISPAEEKRREFLKYNPPPQEPRIPTGSWKENEGVWEKEWATHLFAQDDYQRRLRIFMQGAASAPERKLFQPLGGGKAAIRSEDGTVTVLDEANLGVRETAKRLGLDEDKALQAVYLNNGKYDSGKQTGAIRNGTIFDYALDYNLLAGPGDPLYSRRLVGSERAALPPEVKFPKDLNEFVGKLARLDTTDPEVEDVLAMVDKVANVRLKSGQKSQRIFSPEATDYFQGRWPGYSINIERTDQGTAFWRALKYTPILGWLIPDKAGRKGYAANVVKGTLVPLRIDEERQVPVYVDTQGVVRDRHNQVIGTNLEEATFNLRAQLGKGGGR